MENSLQALNLGSSVFDLLSKGEPVSDRQLAELAEGVKSSPKFQEILEKNTANVLRSLAEHGKTSSSILMRGVTSESLASAVLAASTDNLSPSSKNAAFYVNLCLNLCVRYPQLAGNVANELFGMLATEDESVRGEILLALVMITRQNPLAGEKLVVDYLDSVFSCDPDTIADSTYVLAFRTLETFFAVVPALMKAVYTSEKCKTAVLARVAKLQLEQNASDIQMAELILKTASLSCVDEAARKFNMDHYLELFIAGTKVETHPAVVSLSLLCLVKIWNFSAIELRISLQTILEKVLGSFNDCDVDDLSIEYLVEALAYLSLGASVKKELRANHDLCEKLVLVLETRRNSLQYYGALVVLQNLSQMKEKLIGEDAKTVNFLKEHSLPNKNQVEDDDLTIKSFNESLVQDLKLVETLKALDLKGDSQAQAIFILHNMSNRADRKTERAIVAQGGLTILIKYLVQHSTVKKGSEKTHAVSTSEKALQTRLRALQALAFVCWSVDPKLLISEYDIITVVPFLVELLGPQVNQSTLSTEPTGEDAIGALGNLLNPLDTLYALLALTNVSSSQEENLVASIFRRTFDQHLKDLMIDSSVPDIQKATWELISNLASNSNLLARFFNVANPESMKNLNVLVNLLHSKNADLQVVVGGLLANSVFEGDIVSLALMSDEANILDKLLDIFGSIFLDQAENEPLIARVTAILQVMMEVACEAIPVAYKRILSHKSLQDGLRKGYLTVRNPTSKSCMGDVIGFMKENS